MPRNAKHGKDIVFVALIGLALAFALLAIRRGAQRHRRVARFATTAASPADLCKLNTSQDMCAACKKPTCRVADCETEFFTFPEGNVTSMLADAQKMEKIVGLNVDLLKVYQSALENSKSAIRTALIAEMMTTNVNIGHEYGGKSSPVNDIQFDYQALSEGNLSYRLHNLVGLFCPDTCRLEFGTFNIMPTIQHSSAPTEIEVRAQVRVKTCPKALGTLYTHLGVGTTKASGDIELVILLSGEITLTLGPDSDGYVTIKTLAISRLDKQYVSTKVVGNELNALRGIASFFTGKNADAMIDAPVNSALVNALPRVIRAVNRLGRRAVSGTATGLKWYMPAIFMQTPVGKKYFDACHGPTVWGGTLPGEAYKLKNARDQCSRPSTALRPYRVPTCGGIVCGKAGPCGTCTNCPECRCLMRCMFGGRCVPV